MAGLSQEGLVTVVVVVAAAESGIVVREHVAVTDNVVGADGHVLHGGEDGGSERERVELARTRVEEQIRRGGGRDGKEVLPSGLVLRRRGGPLPSASAEQTLSLSTFLPSSANDFWALVALFLFLFFVVDEA